MVMIGVRETAVGPDQLDPVFLDTIDSADVDAVRADHFHMLANVFEAAHLYLLQALTRLNAPPPTGMHAAATRLRLFGARVIGRPWLVTPRRGA